MSGPQFVRRLQARGGSSFAMIQKARNHCLEGAYILWALSAPDGDPSGSPTSRRDA